MGHVLRRGTKIGRAVHIGDFSILGEQYRSTSDREPVGKGPTIIGDRCWIGSHVVVGKGTRLGRRVMVEDFSKVECNVTLGKGSHLFYGAQVCNDAEVGERSRIGGFVGERSKVGDECRIFGALVHDGSDFNVPWDEAVEPAPTLGNRVFVGFYATIAGGVRIGDRAKVSAGSLVVGDVPPGRTVYGYWNGKPSGSRRAGGARREPRGGKP